MLISSTLLERLIEPGQGSFSVEHAHYVLSLKFTEADKGRCLELSYKAQDTALTPEERRELELYLSADNFLILLKLKAQRSLEQHPLAT